MRKIFASLIIFSASMTVNSQISKGTFTISVNGNYYDGSNSIGVATNSLLTNIQDLNTGISIEYFVKKNLFIGVGFDYSWSNEYRFSGFSSNSFAQVELMNVKSNLLLPNIIGGYSFQLMKKLYLNTNFKIGYGRYSNKTYSDYTWIQHTDGGTFTQTGAINEVISWESDNQSSYFGTSLSPEINYFISERFGLCLGLGGIEYAILDWNKDQSSWIVNFNPNFWRLGIKFKI